MHLKRAGKLGRNWETFGLEKSISCFYFLLFPDQPTHRHLTGYIHFFSFTVSLYSYLCLLTALDFVLFLICRHTLSTFFSSVFSLPSGHRWSHLLYCVFFFVRRAAFSIPLPLFSSLLPFPRGSVSYGDGRVCLEEGWTGLTM